MGGRNLRLRNGHGRIIKRSRSTVVRVVIIFFYRDTSPPGLQFFTLRRHHNQLFVVGRPPGPSLPFCSTHGPLNHIRTVVDNTVAQVWYNIGSVRSSSDVGPILCDLALFICHRHMYASIGRVKGEYSKMENYVSRLTYLSDSLFIRHFKLTFPHKNYWILLPLPSMHKGHLTSMMQKKRSPKAFHPHSSKITPPSGANGSNFEVVSISYLIYKRLPIPSPSSRYFPST